MISKGYKHTDLGILPEDWEVVRLGEIGKIVGGGTPSTKKKEFWKGAIPWISSSDIDENDVFNISQTRYITQDAIDKSSTKSIEPNSILVVSRVGIGKVAINQNVLCTSQDIQALTQHNQDAFFLVYAIKNLVSLVCRINQGTSIKGFTKEVLSNLQVPLPPLAEQEKIASVLSTWDIQIQNLQSLITEKQNLKKALCQTLLTAKTRFKGFSEDWQVVRLGDVCKNFGGKSLEKEVSSSGQYRFISIGNYSIDGKYFDNGQRISLNKNTQEKLLEKNDLVMVLNDKTSDGKIIGSTILIDRDNAYIYNQRSERLVCSERLEPLFAWCVLNSKKIRKKIFEISQGGTQIYVNFSSVKNIQIPIPPLTEQKKIAEILSEADNEITLLEQKLESLEIQKKGLMQKLLNGKVRVKYEK